LSLAILSVGYPLAPVSTATAGGAEQIAAQLDKALVQAGHRSIVIACEGSRTAGTLVPVPRTAGIIDEPTKAAAHERHRDAIATALARWRIDVVHLHGIDFHAYLPPPGVPVLATLHLPPSWYPEAALRPSRPDTWLHCVGRAQHAACPQSRSLLPPIENGVAVDELFAVHGKRRFALVLGRICPEKGVHLAIDAAKRADIPLIIAGEVFPYEAHQRYFEEKVCPRLDSRCRFIGPIGFVRKRRLLTAARCVLIPSLAPETSSLVAREALACGTAVIAFPSGALSDTVEHGRTGFLVPDVPAMAAAIESAQALDADQCRRRARERFSLDRMLAQYLERYELLARNWREANAGAA
jgi:1-acyl-sn-glycerol-3-phosphate acyltransferase